MSARRTPETLVPSAVHRWLQEADNALKLAGTATEDAHVREAVASARKTLAPAVRRARAVLQHADLTSARQNSLGL